MRLIDADALIEKCGDWYVEEGTESGFIGTLKNLLVTQPTITPESHEIGYYDCSNALLKMWMDNVLTDGEYYRIADKLNEKWGKKELPEPFKGGENMSDEQEYCCMRLPCGICRLTMTNCPKVNIVYSLSPAWVSTNCEVNIHTNNEDTE